MEKDQFNKKIDRLIKEAVALEAKVKLDLETAEFLNNEAIKLEEIIDNPKSTQTQTEESYIKMEALYKRIMIETKVDNTIEQNRIKKELIVLNNIEKGKK